MFRVSGVVKDFTGRDSIQVLEFFRPFGAKGLRVVM